MFSQFVFATFWQREIAANAVCKMLVKLTTALHHLRRLSRHWHDERMRQSSHLRIFGNYCDFLLCFFGCCKNAQILLLFFLSFEVRWEDHQCWRRWRYNESRSMLSLVNVISTLMWSYFKLAFIIDYYVKIIGYCYHSVNVITFGLPWVITLRGFHCITFLNGAFSVFLTSFSTGGSRNLILDRQTPNNRTAWIAKFYNPRHLPFVENHCSKPNKLYIPSVAQPEAPWNQPVRTFVNYCNVIFKD